MSFKLSTYVTLKDKFRSVKSSSSLFFDSNSNSICKDTQKQFDIAGKQIELLQDIFDSLDEASDYSNDEKAAIITGALITTKRKSEIRSYKNYIETIDVVLGVNENNKLSKSEALTYKNVYLKYKEKYKLYKLSHAYCEFLPLTDLEKEFIAILHKELKKYQVNNIEELPSSILQAIQQVEVFISYTKILKKELNSSYEHNNSANITLPPDTQNLDSKAQRKIHVNKLTFCNSPIFSARIITSSLDRRIDKDKVTKPSL